MADPFEATAPHPLVRAAAETVMRELERDEVSARLLDARREGGKMFGVLLVRADDGRLGWLKAFSGQLGFTWQAQGWAPPLFDVAARAEIESRSDATLAELTARVEAHRSSEALRAGLAARDAREAEREGLRALHAGRRAVRREKRSAGEPVADLDGESRRDSSERKRFEARALEAEAPLEKLQRRGRALERLRRIVSQEAMRRILATYVLRNARGEEVRMPELFEHGVAPWGAGECAAPKLLAHALRLEVKPVALAEFWWGPPPAGGGRVQGAFFPACRLKCGPLLPFLLRA